VDPAALAHEMLSLLRRVRVPVVWWALRQRQIAESVRGGICSPPSALARRSAQI
jgi:hypothetical protein